MINKINVINSASDVTRLVKPAFKGYEAKDLSEIKEQEYSDAQALTNYWAASINLAKKHDLKPIDSKLLNITDIESISGKKIYNSKGELHSIVDNNGEKTVYYYPDDENKNLISKMIITDKDTDNIIYSEDSEIEDGKYISNRVFVYSPKTGKEIAYSRYEDGEIKYYSKTNYLKNNITEKIEYDAEDKQYYVSKENSDKNKSITIQYKNGLKDVVLSTTSQPKKNTVIDKDYNFYNGALTSIREEKTTIFPNLQGQEPLLDKDIQPHEKIDLSKYTTDMDGEHTYYSNGTVETVKTDDTEVLFSPKGFVKSVETPELTITSSDNGYQCINEHLGEDALRITEYYSDGSINVLYKEKDTYKEIWLDDQLRLYHYCEGKFDSEDKKIDNTSMWYKNGILETVY